MLPEEIVFANAAKVNNCHCEESYDVAIGIQVRMTYRAGQPALAEVRDVRTALSRIATSSDSSQ